MLNLLFPRPNQATLREIVRVYSYNILSPTETQTRVSTSEDQSKSKPRTKFVVISRNLRWGDPWHEEARRNTRRSRNGRHRRLKKATKNVASAAKRRSVAHGRP